MASDQLSTEIMASNKVIFIDMGETTETDSKEEKPVSIKEEKHPCPECKYKAHSNDRLTRHIRSKHRGLKPYQCEMCEYSTNNSVMYQDHCNMHKGIKPYKCAHCPYRSVSKKYIKMHEMKHAICQSCGYRAKNSKALAKHKQTDCNNDEFTCKSCDMSFHSGDKLFNHVKLHKQCCHCKESFLPEILARHVKNKHSDEGSCKFQCAFCNWKSNLDRKILLHLIHHPDQKETYCFNTTNKELTLNVNTTKICRRTDFCKMDNTSLCTMRLKNNASEYRNFANWCELFKHNLCIYPDIEFAIIDTQSCERYLKRRRQNSENITSTDNSVLAADNSTIEADNSTLGGDNSAIARAGATTKMEEFSPLYDVDYTFDGKHCPHSCTETYKPICINVNKGSGKEFKFFIFVNQCYGYLFYCKHHKEFRPAMSREWNSDEEILAAVSPLDWSFCGASRYLNFARFAEATSSMGYYGWLHGNQRYSKILEPHERHRGYG